MLFGLPRLTTVIGLASLRGVRSTGAVTTQLSQMSTTCTPSAPRDIPFVLFGVGGVGNALLEAIVSARSLHAERYGVRFCAVAVCDSGASVGSTGGLSDADLHAVMAHKAAGNKLATYAGANARGQEQSAAAFLQGVATQCAGASPGCIVVDCTATDATVPALLMAAGGDGVPDVRAVTANKKPVSGPMDEFRRLALGPHSAARFRYEATVGAGLPVIAALGRVVGAADPVTLISGSFSGTLGYVMSGLQAGQPFSEVVAKAKDLGYTEPDPRDDLGGVDVARKALILARTMGMSLEMEDVAVEPLYPVELAEVSVAEFMAALPSLDAGVSAKVSAAAAEGKVLRYAASVNPPTVEKPSGSLSVGLLAVGSDTPLGTLAGSDNLVEIHTGWYSSTPLVLRGAGAGTGTTAAGVLADMLELANAR